MQVDSRGSHSALAAALAYGADLIIGLGGGSSMDVAKLVALLATNEKAAITLPRSIIDPEPRLGLIQIPTTAGTGSEATSVAFVTKEGGSKFEISARQMMADLIVLDAELTLPLPPMVCAATGIDAMVHAIEVTTNRRHKNPVSDMLAHHALNLLFRNLIIACENPENLSARQALLLGACMAGQAYSNANLAAVHALADPVGSLFYVPHGLSTSLMLPHVLRYNLPSASEQYAELAGIVVPHVEGSIEARAEALIVAMQQIAKITGIETTLQQVGICEDDLDRMAILAMLHTELLDNNPRKVNVEAAKEIYTAAL